jgi:hypothetical protein
MADGFGTSAPCIGLVAAPVCGAPRQRPAVESIRDRFFGPDRPGTGRGWGRARDWIGGMSKPFTQTGFLRLAAAPEN